ncbi:MAG: helix-turn-helix domain-containing protein [Chroococcidiopsidaceae cyanobacterium CP_BM_ER_R8_30]|nr:helix-turn-helix domain-containing protein [Chroococcidiopsidaceae cyanobacterium CP_BM_ER_R8_30]
MKWRQKKHLYESIHLFEQRQVEKLRELGACLRKVRLEQAMSLEEIAAKTRIRLCQLQAIETAEIDELPEPVYIRSFIKQYADVLGLNGAELSSAFPTSSSLRLLKPSWKTRATQLRPIHLYLLYILVIVCAISGLSNILSRSELQVNDSQNPQKPNFRSAPQQGQSVVKHLDPLELVSASSSNATQTNKQVRIGITLQAQSWIQVVVDGKTQFQGILPEGTQRSWIAQEQLTVRVGNAGGVLLSLNQEKAHKMGNPGEVQQVTFGANPKI